LVRAAVIGKIVLIPVVVPILEVPRMARGGCRVGILYESGLTEGGVDGAEERAEGVGGGGDGAEACLDNRTDGDIASDRVLAKVSRKE
jgi:hypothetical protein